MRGVDLPEEVSVLSLRSSAREVMAAVGLLQEGQDGPAPLPRPRVAARPRPDPLTERERAVLGHVSQGYTTVQISALLGISAKTIDNHKRRIYAKLGVHNQAHAVGLAVRNGMITSASRVPESEVARGG
jgi:DNA-binding CsgD family transcriptional regulator